MAGTILDYLEFGPAAGLTDEERERGLVTTSPAYKPGRPADHATGITYFAPWEPVADGFAEHARRSVRALATTGEPVSLRSYYQRGGEPSEEFRAIETELAPLLSASIARPKVEIHQLVPTEEMLYRQAGIGHPAFSEEDLRQINRFRIFSTVWERDRISLGALQALRQVGQVWVACEMNRQMLERAGVDPARLRVVPVPFFANDPHLALWGRPRQPGPVRFYHIGKWEPRKAQDRIILAFLSAFRPGQAELYLRIGGLMTAITGYPQSPVVAVHDALGDPIVKSKGWTLHNVNHGVKWIPLRMSAQKLVELHELGDVYVSLSRGEGWDLPAFSAKLAGNLLVYTPSGGPQDYAGAEDVMVEPRGQVGCHPFYRWNQDACYLEFSVDRAILALQKAAERVASHGRVSGRDLSEFEARNVGERMRQYVNELLVLERAKGT